MNIKHLFLLITIFLGSCQSNIDANQKSNTKNLTIEKSNQKIQKSSKPYQRDIISKSENCKCEDLRLNEYPKYSGTGKFISMKENDPCYLEFINEVQDSILISGWKIEYLVKDDSTYHHHLYLKWSKDVISNYECLNSVLLLRPYFTPKFSGENSDFIFLVNDIANGSQLTLLPKKQKSKALIVPYFIDYSLKQNIIIYTPNKDYIVGSSIISILDLKTMITKEVHFDKKCEFIESGYCIDEVAFFEKHIIVYTTFTDSLGANSKEKTKINL